MSTSIAANCKKLSDTSLKYKRNVENFNKLSSNLANDLKNMSLSLKETSDLLKSKLMYKMKIFGISVSNAASDLTKKEIDTILSRSRDLSGEYILNEIKKRYNTLFADKPFLEKENADLWVVYSIIFLSLITQVVQSNLQGPDLNEFLNVVNGQFFLESRYFTGLMPSDFTNPNSNLRFKVESLDPTFDEMLEGTRVLVNEVLRPLDRSLDRSLVLIGVDYDVPDRRNL